MIHFTIDERSKVINIRAVFGTGENPEKWEKRN